MADRVLLVDDNENLLDGLRRSLRGRFDLTAVSDPAAALAMIDDGPPFSVIVSDIDMPGVTGIELLSAARQRAPETIRIVLTGTGDQQVAIDAVNKGQVFRFLTKPCPTPELAEAIADGIHEHHLSRALAENRPTANVADADAGETAIAARDIGTALADKRFILHYQPIIALKTRALAGFEALVRWPLPDGGFIEPSRFIAVAEAYGLIGAITLWGAREAADRLQQWSDTARDLTMNVNLSSLDLVNADVVDGLVAAGTEPVVASGRVKLELTESVMVTDPDRVARNLNRLADVGYSICIDDFGTGYSSLSYLHRLPVHVLKIDRSFVTDIETSDEARHIVEMIVGLAQRLGAEVTAEGIETPGQLELLTRLGCTYGQGFQIAKPLDSDDAWLLVQDHAAACPDIA